MAAPLTSLLKKGRGWPWRQECQHDFESLKEAFTKEVVLCLPDLRKPFELHIDALEFAIGAVLIQEGHQIAFDNQKLNNTKGRYIV